MSRFVVLQHDLPPGSDRPTHWDFMLELDGRLRTWAFESVPRAGSAIRAISLPDHRIDYLDYEGPISGDRGEVTRLDAGEFELREAQDGLYKGILRGSNMTASFVARRTKSTDEWQFQLFKVEVDAEQLPSQLR